jgi:hypothetical protein
MFVFIALFPLGLLAVVMLLAQLERGLTSGARGATGSSERSRDGDGRTGALHAGSADGVSAPDASTRTLSSAP